MVDLLVNVGIGGEIYWSMSGYKVDLLVNISIQGEIYWSLSDPRWNLLVNVRSKVKFTGQLMSDPRWNLLVNVRIQGESFESMSTNIMHLPLQSGHDCLIIVVWWYDKILGVSVQVCMQTLTETICRWHFQIHKSLLYTASNIPAALESQWCVHENVKFDNQLSRFET